MDRLRTPDSVGAHLGEPDMAHVALLDELGNRTDRVLDGHVRIQSRRAIDVDVLDTQSFKRVGDKISHCGRPGIIAVKLARARSAQRTKFDAELNSVSISSLERLAYEDLVVPHPIEIAGVEEGDALVQRLMNGGNALCAVRRAV